MTDAPSSVSVLQLIALVGAVVVGYLGAYMTVRSTVEKLDKRLENSAERLDKRLDNLVTKSELDGIRKSVDNLTERVDRLIDARTGSQTDEVVERVTRQFEQLLKPILERRSAKSGERE